VDVIQNNTNLYKSNGSESVNNALELASQGAIVIVKCRAEIKIVLDHAN